jgi:hypothetical protein
MRPAQPIGTEETCGKLSGSSKKKLCKLETLGWKRTRMGLLPQDGMLPNEDVVVLRDHLSAR